MTGRLVQVIEGLDIRLLYGPAMSEPKDNVIIAMRGEIDEEQGVSEKIIQMVETSEISSTPSVVDPGIPSEVWEEWDM